MTHTIRLAKESDIASLLELEQQCFSSDQLSRRSFARLIKPGAHCLLVADSRGQVKGYVLVFFRQGSLRARVYSIAVSSQARGQGIAQDLMEQAERLACERQCRFMRLEVDALNTAAQQLYAKAGYQAFARIEGYYEDGSDAIRLEKPLG